LPEYKHEVGLLFTGLIRQRASGADNRRDYSEVCRLIKLCDNACPGAAGDIYVEIAQKYARRPAFMDEMRKIGRLSN